MRHYLTEVRSLSMYGPPLEAASRGALFEKVFQSNFIEVEQRDGCSPVHLLHIARTPFPKYTSGGLLLLYVLSL